jgi:hypothetical protein
MSILEQLPSSNPAFQLIHTTPSGKVTASRLVIQSTRFLKESCDLVRFEQDLHPVLPDAITCLADGSYQLILPCSNGIVTALIRAKVSNQSVEWDLSLFGFEQKIKIHFPFLSQLTLGPESQYIDWHTLTDRRGNLVARYLNYQSPFLISGGEESLVLLQCGSLVETEYDPSLLIQRPGLTVSINPQPVQVYQATVRLTSGGWRGAFSSIRAYLRAQLDLSEYNRPDLQWYSEQFVQHFTFLYGQEILNLERGEFDIDRFLDEGERDFGGYDGFLVWGVYPRIGVDERTQWDFYNDLPGGREGFKSISRRARERGVRFFVPYKPWDRSAEKHGAPVRPDEVELAQLIEDTEADGVFLDTMLGISPEFRQEIDRRKSGVVFCSEGRARGREMEIVTGCWEQSDLPGWMEGNWSAPPETMPQSDLWRFVLPEHRLFVISRHSTAGDRVRITQRGFFNGMGWVIWQDIFGLILPYTPVEAALVKKCSTIFHENRLAVNSPNPTPLLETLVDGLYANEFPSETKRMWTFYNENDHPISGGILHVEPRENTHFVDVWNECELNFSQGTIQASNIAARDVGCVIEYPRLIEISSNGVRIPNPKPGMWLVIRKAGNQSTLAVINADWVELSLRPGKMVIKLVMDSEVVDQISMSGKNVHDKQPN